MVRFLLVMDGIDSLLLQRSPSVSLVLELVLLPIVLLVLSPGLVMATQVSTFGAQNSPSLAWILILQPAVRSSIPITSSISRTLLWICSMDSSHRLSQELLHRRPQMQVSIVSIVLLQHLITLQILLLLWLVMRPILLDSKSRLELTIPLSMFKTLFLCRPKHLEKEIKSLVLEEVLRLPILSTVSPVMHMQK